MDSAERIVTKLFQKGWIGDATLSDNKVERMFTRFRKVMSEPKLLKVRLVTIDELVPKVIRQLLASHPSESTQADAADDIVSLQLNSAS